MSVALTVLLVLELAAGAVLLLRWRAHRDRVAAFESRVAETARPAPRDAGCEAITPPILVEILNAQELAARESWTARHFGTLVPRHVGREVAGRAAEQLAAQLATEGVRAEVTVLGPGQPASSAVTDLTDLIDLTDLDEPGGAGPAGVREVRRTISAVPFALLGQAPSAAPASDPAADGAGDPVQAVDGLAARLLRRRAR
ncbi:MAG: hypothetical protein AB7J32_09910 [Pseudonocardia sp.]